jgi:hypothetical protein
MKVVFVFFAVWMVMVGAQTISPCITSCVTQFCPKGVSDVECYCYGLSAKDIAQCIPVRCTSMVQADNLWNQFCECPQLLFSSEISDCLVGGFIPSTNTTLAYSGTTTGTKSFYGVPTNGYSGCVNCECDRHE